MTRLLCIPAQYTLTAGSCQKNALAFGLLFLKTPDARCAGEYVPHAQQIRRLGHGDLLGDIVVGVTGQLETGAARQQGARGIGWDDNCAGVCFLGQRHLCARGDGNRLVQARTDPLQDHPGVSPRLMCYSSRRPC